MSVQFKQYRLAKSEQFEEFLKACGKSLKLVQKSNQLIMSVLFVRCELSYKKNGQQHLFNRSISKRRRQQLLIQYGINIPNDLSKIRLK